MREDNIPVITDREELYDKCDNMEQLFDKYYLPLLYIHYRKTYNLQQENKKYKEVIDKTKNKLYEWGEALNPEFQKIMLDILKESGEQ